MSFYYKWKKTLRGTEALMQHKRVLQQPVPFNVLKQARAPAAVCSGGSGVGSTCALPGMHSLLSWVDLWVRSPLWSCFIQLFIPMPDALQSDEDENTSEAASKPKRKRKKSSKGNAKGSSHEKEKPAEPEIHIVESIRQSRMDSNGQPEYQVKWQDYPLEADWTWEPYTNLANNGVFESYLL